MNYGFRYHKHKQVTTSLARTVRSHMLAALITIMLTLGVAVVHAIIGGK